MRRALHCREQEREKRERKRERRAREREREIPLVRKNHCRLGYIIYKTRHREPEFIHACIYTYKYIHAYIHSKNASHTYSSFGICLQAA